MWEPIYGILGNGTTIQYVPPGTTPSPDDDKTFVLPCDMLGPKDTALSFKFGGVEFGMQWRDFV